MDRKGILIYLFNHKKGKREDLEKIMSKEEVEGLGLTGDINLSEKYYKVNEQLINTYNSTIKKTTLGEKILGLVCHYVLQFR